MFRINGIGTTMLGFTDADQDGNCFATMWFTFLYIPILPLKRLKIHRVDEISFLEIERTPIVLNEVLLTYIKTPIIGFIIFWPFLLIPFSDYLREDRGIDISTYLAIFTIIWIFLSVLILKHIQGKKGRVK